MKFNFEETKIYVRPGATDLRKGTCGFLAIIEEVCIGRWNGDIKNEILCRK